MLPGDEEPFNTMRVWIGCFSGMCGRFYSLQEIFRGAAGGAAGDGSQAIKKYEVAYSMLHQ